MGEKRPNRFRIYDMSGNVWEWVEDCWNENYEGAPSDGSAWLSGKCEIRVLRGGSWNNGGGYARCANRIWVGPDYRDFVIGFRCVRTIS